MATSLWKFILGGLIVLISWSSYAVPSDVNSPQGALWNLLESGRQKEALVLEDQLRKVLLSAPIDRIAPLGGGVSASWLVYFENNVVAVLKGEDPDVERSVQREAAAYVVDRALGFNMVPLTVLRKIGGLTYSLQLYYPNSSIESLVEQGVHPELKTSRQADMGLFDYVISNIDRKRPIRHNLLSGLEGRLIAIDHARTFFLTDEFDLTLHQEDLDESSKEFREKILNLDTEKLVGDLKAYVSEEQIKDLVGRLRFVKRNIEGLSLESYPQVAEYKRTPKVFQAPRGLKEGHDLARISALMNPYQGADPFVLLQKFTSYGNLEKDPAFIHVSNLWPQSTDEEKSIFLKLIIDVQARFNPRPAIPRMALSILKSYPQDLALLEKALPASLISSDFAYFVFDLSKEARFSVQDLKYLRKIVWSDLGPLFVRLFMIGTSLDKIQSDFRNTLIERSISGLQRGEFLDGDVKLLFTQDRQEALRYILQFEISATQKKRAVTSLKGQLQDVFESMDRIGWREDYIQKITKTYNEIQSSIESSFSYKSLRCEGLF